jgi:HEXXH motif-containing protein
VVPTVSGAPALVDYFPQLLTWRDSNSFLDLLNALYLEGTDIRVRQAFDDIERWDSELALVMRESLDALPPWAAARFAIAPETQRRLSLLLNDPATHIAFLCRALKAESVLSGEAVVGQGCWTALGDYYLASGENAVVDPRVSNWSPNVGLRAPRLAQAVPVDWASPNSRDISSPQLPFELHTPDEAAEAWALLNRTFAYTASVNAAAGQLIKRLVRAIIALKTSTGEPGSSSDYSCPGRVMLRNSHVAPEGKVASGLLHEAIHQALYTVESFGRFVDKSSRQTVVSPWTNRKLALHSYLHACFVWYGLVKFWQQALEAKLFPRQSAQGELHQALAGFHAGNPVDRLLPYRNEICPKALRSVAALYDELRSAGDVDAGIAANRLRPLEAGAAEKTTLASISQ